MQVAKQKASSAAAVMRSEEANDSLDAFIRQAIGKEPFLSFSNTGDNPIQWIQLLHALDQQGTGKFSSAPKINTIEEKKHSIEDVSGLNTFASEINGYREPVHHIRSGGLPLKGTKNASDHLQSLKIPEAVFAFAQATATEKYLPGWPLISPVKMQLQKCEKCSREFGSTINYRRHIRLHRRSLNIDRDFTINTREALGTFWDKLSAEEAMEIVSFKDITLEEVPGSSIIKALTSFNRKPGFSTLPPAYMKAGAALLDIVQVRPSRFPVLSQELFNILDDASEKTFLCAGKAESLQKYVFDGEAGKIGLEMRNLVACTSFLIEQKLVKAWLADKDAESLRCQKLLVEEEEAAQKRQAELLERKRQKKLRQREQKAKAQANGAVADSQEECADTSDSGVPSPSASSPLDPSDSPSEIPDFLRDPISLSHELNQKLIEEDDENNEPLSTSDIGCSRGNGGAEHKTWCRNGRVHMSNSRWHVQKLHRGYNGFHTCQNYQGTKVGSMQKYAFCRDSRNISLNNGNKVWTPKRKSENDEESCRAQSNNEETIVSDQNKNLEVLIGSISVTIGNCNSQPHEEQLGNLHTSDIETPVPKCSIQNKPTKPENRSVVRLWRPVSRHENGGRHPVTNDSEIDVIGCKGSDELLRACPSDFNAVHESNPVPAAEDGHLVAMRFSSSTVEAFLAQRWKEAVAADHVELVILETEPPGCPVVQDECAFTCNGENQVPCAGAFEIKSKYRLQFESARKV